jgi:hypothetical protein
MGCGLPVSIKLFVNFELVPRMAVNGSRWMFGELERNQIISACERQLALQGVSVEQVQDFRRIEEILSKSKKDYLTPVVSPLSNDLLQSNAIWLVAWREGRPVIVGGSRLEDLAFESVSSFWPRSLERLYGRKSGDLIESVSPRLAALLQGRLAYFGDLHVMPGERGVLSSVRSFVTIGHMLVSLKWDPDFTYAFIHDRGVAKSAGYRYGFNYAIPNAMKWSNPPHPRSDQEWCAIVSRQDLPFVARQAAGKAIEEVSGLLVKGERGQRARGGADGRQMISEL